MFENFKAQLHSNEKLLESWHVCETGDSSFSITKQFDLANGICYSDVCMTVLNLGHVPQIMTTIEKREGLNGDPCLHVSITISATEADTLATECEKLALKIECLLD